MDPTEIDTKKMNALVKAYKKELEKADSTEIQSLKKEIGKLNDAETDYFVQKYAEVDGAAAPSSPLPVPAAAAAPDRYLNALGTDWPKGVPRKVPKGGKSRRRRNKKGKKKTNKRRRN